MDAEKNVVEAARAVVATRGWDLLGGSHEKIVALRAALSAYDSAPAPSEDRVREAAEAAIIAWFGGESDPKRRPKATRDIMDAIRRYVTPAPALPPGTVAVSVETLRTWKSAAGLIASKPADHIMACKLIEEIDALLPPPPAPEPSAELVAEWTRRGEEYAITYPFSDGWGELERDPVIHAVRDTLRAEWAKKGGG